MGYIEVYTENTDGTWNLRVGGFGPFNYTFPGNQYGSTQTHEWIFVEWIADNGDWEENGDGAFGGVANDQVIGLNQTITINTNWDSIYYRAEFYFRIHNLRSTASTITYLGNGATEGSTASNFATQGNTFTFQANGFTRTGYSFNAWELTDSNNSIIGYYAEGISYGIWDRTGNYTAKAQWTPKTYTVTFNSNGKGTGKTVTQGVDTTVTCPILKAVGYVFGGWAISSTSTTVNKEGNATFVLGTANQSFFAIWTENTNGSVSFSELQTVYTGTHPIGISEYRTQSGQTTANSKIALSADFKGKGPAP
jgi:hypothetical protein